MVDRTEYEIDHVIAEGMESLLADIIQKYPVLYDKDMKHRYGVSFQSKSDTAWNKISDELNLELESCKSLWSCMKQKFIKHRKRLDNGEPVNPWPTYNKLHQWLDRHVKKRKSRIDYIKQMKVPAKPLLKCQTENIEDDDTNEPDEEWAELLDDKKTTVQIQLKRKFDDSMDSLSQTIANDSKSDSKKKFNIEVISESGTTIYDDSEIFSDSSEQKSLIKDTEIVVLDKAETSQIEVIEVKESVKSETSRASNDFDDFIKKIEQILSKHMHSNEPSTENLTFDSNDAFGKYIASMVRELPSEKRMKIRLNILQYATELISKEGSN